MEFFVILFIVVLGVIVIGSIMGMTNSGRITKLEKQNRNLNRRLKALESGGERTVSRGQSITAPAEPQPPFPVSSVPEPEPIPEAKPIDAPVSEPVSEPVPVKPAPQPVTASASAPIKTSPEKPSWARPAPKPEKPARNLEELIGGQWSVWVGGLALLVGAVLLIRFSIEAGFFGPGARIAMAVVLGIVLLLAGEWLKRSDDKVLKGRLGEAAKALQENASVPGLLSAVGIFTLLGASYAAHELYGLIPALLAFLALAVISLGAMALSLRQGPLLAGIGLLASLATPLLIQTNSPSLSVLIIYLVLIGAAALALARKTGWGWLATGTVFGWLGWSMMSIEAATNGQLILWSAFLALGFGVTVWFADQEDASENEGLAVVNLNPVLAILWGGLAALLVGTVIAQSENSTAGIETSPFFLGLASSGALVAASVLFKKQFGHVVVAGLLALGVMMMSGENWQSAVLMIAIFGIVCLVFHHAQRSIDLGQVKFQREWSVFAVVLGLISIGALDVSNPQTTDDIHGAIALAYTGFFAGVAAWVRRRGADWTTNAIPVIGAGLGWSLAAFLMFEGLSFSLFISFGAALAALTVWRFRMPGARLALLGLAALVFAHALLIQFPYADAISARPILNALWAYLAFPTVILGATAFILHRREEIGEFPKFVNGVIEAAAMAGLALFAVFQIRHLSNGGEVYADSMGHAELGLQISIGLCFTLAGLSKRFAGNLVLSKIAEVISYVTLAGFALGSLMTFSPLFARGEIITGNIAFNSLTTGLLVPTVLLGLCAAMARGRRAEIYINILGGLALAGALSWVTAMIRFIYNGGNIHVWRVGFSDLELWTISVIWLGFGIALLALGVWRRERALRIASGIVIILTVLKAFLIDMAGLEGVLRALSFVALGLILIVIGRAYQRYWLSDQVKEKEA